MSYANPIDTRLVQIVLDDLEDNNHHTTCELLAWAYGVPWGSIPDEVMEGAYQAANTVLFEYRWNEAKELADV